MTRSMRVGPIPIPVAAFAATVEEEVTKGYVPWSRSSSVACDDGGCGVDSARFELVELGEQHLGIDDATGADQRPLAGDRAARNLSDLERLAVRDDRVPRVRPALVAAHEIGFLRKQVDDL